MRRVGTLKKFGVISTVLIAMLFSSSTVLAAIEGFVTASDDGNYYEYEYDVLLDSYVSRILGSAAPVFADYSKKKMYAFRDSKNGYVDYEDILESYVKAILENKAFDAGEYASGKQAKKAKMPPELYVVTQDSGGKLQYTKKILETATDVIAALAEINAATSAAALKNALLSCDDLLGLALNRYSLTAAEQNALAGRLLELKPFASPRELQRLLHISVIALRFGYTITHPRYDYTLGAMVDKQMALTSCPPQTDLYGGGWKNAKRDDVQHYLDPYNFIDMDYGSAAKGSVKITADPNLKVRQRPTTKSDQLQDSSDNDISVWKGEVYAILGEAQAEAGTQGGTEGTWYKIRASGQEGWVCGKYCQVIDASFSPASMFQFLLLSGSAGTTAADLNKILSGKGILHGTGAAFMQAGQGNQVNEIFLVSLALHESGNGTSLLAKGIEVEDKDKLYPGGGGEYTREAKINIVSGPLREGPTTASKTVKDSSNNEITVKQDEVYKILDEQTAEPETEPGTTGPWYKIRAEGKEGWVCGAHVKVTAFVKVYNMFGIGAYDSNPNKYGSERAYSERWLTPEQAIVGGAKFASEGYVNRPSCLQNTLYKMRWNPNNPATHQYATDIGWAAKQVSGIKKLYDLIDNYTLTFEIPRYKE